MDQYTNVLLLNPSGTKIVLLKRFAGAKFAPNRWTGIGGHIGRGEDVTIAALRELFEETGISQNEVKNFRMVADFIYDSGPYWPRGYRIVYFDGIYTKEKLPDCSEGVLKWIPIGYLHRYDIIDDTRAVLKILKQKIFNKEVIKPLKGKFQVGEKGVTDHVIIE